MSAVAAIGRDASHHPDSRVEAHPSEGGVPADQLTSAACVLALKSHWKCARVSSCRKGFGRRVPLRPAAPRAHVQVETPRRAVARGCLVPGHRKLRKADRADIEVAPGEPAESLGKAAHRSPVSGVARRARDAAVPLGPDHGRHRSGLANERNPRRIREISQPDLARSRSGVRLRRGRPPDA